MAIASACSFPEPALVPGEGGATESGSQDGQPTESAPSDAGLVDSVFSIDGNENVDPEGGAQEASTRPDGAALVDAAGCPDKCDCDGDGVRSDNPSCGPTGADCNDLDPFVPHDGFVADPPPPGADGDWDCDGTVTKQFPVNVNCGVLSDCNAAGFTGDPACGTFGQFVTCAPTLVPLVCKDGGVKLLTQGCR
jgi:hypothetical protein